MHLNWRITRVLCIPDFSVHLCSYVSL